jgi:hypothetical protein
VGRYQYLKSVSVFGIFSVFLKVYTVFGIGIAKYRGIGIGIFNPYKTLLSENTVFVGKASIIDMIFSPFQGHKLNSFFKSIYYS